MDSNDRGKSFIRRIADSLTSIVPTSIFHSPKRTREDEFEVPSAPSPITMPLSESRVVLQKHRDWSGFAQNTNCSSTNLPMFPSHSVDLDACEDNISIHSQESNHSVSTSGVSSLLPHETTKSKRPKLYTPSMITQDNECTESKDLTLIEKLNKRSHTFDVDESRSKRICSRSTTILDDSPASQPHQHSMFYTGNTSYGGASSVCSLRLLSSQNSAPLRYELISPNTGRQRKSYPNESASSAILSSTARRILENMEKMSSPLTRFDPVPPPKSLSGSIRSFTTSTSHSSRYPPYMSAFQRFKKLQNEQRKMEREQPPVTTSSSTAWNPPPPPPTLLPPSNPVVIPTITITEAPSVPVVADVSDSPKETPREFHFSQPERLNAPRKVQEVSSTFSEAFFFARPEKLMNKTPINVVAQSPIFSAIMAGASPETAKPASMVMVKKPKKITLEPVWRCINCLVEMPESKKFCTKCLLPQSLTTLPPPAAKKQAEDLSDGWSCETCLVKNKESDLACVCCQTKKKQEQPAMVVKETASSNWTCDACLVPNKASDSVCVCCQTAKPGAKKVEKVQSDWTCDTCLVANKSTATKCACCETEKAGGQKANTTESSSSVKFSFTDNSNASSVFKFGGSTPAAPLNFGTPAVVTTATTISESAPVFNFGSVAKPSFNFAAPATTTTKTETSFVFGAKPAAAPETGFKFGATTASTSGFNFSATPAGSAFSFGSATPTAASVNVFSSGAGADSGTPIENRVVKKAVRRLRKP